MRINSKPLIHKRLNKRQDNSLPARRGGAVLSKTGLLLQVETEALTALSAGYAQTDDDHYSSAP